jgi:hypothetical protein
MAGHIEFPRHTQAGTCAQEVHRSRQECPPIGASTAPSDRNAAGIPPDYAAPAAEGVTICTRHIVRTAIEGNALADAIKEASWVENPTYLS